MSTSSDAGVALVALVALLLIAAAIALAAAAPGRPDCDFQRTAGNWQPACSHVH